ncbi:MAG: acyloxyacyl hydrolase [Bacteroidia bacterium]|nr:acyloxyacyl hydrolase [Bacteroidia bacterium]
MRNTALLFCLLFLAFSARTQDIKKVAWSVSAQNINAFLLVHDKAFSYLKGTTGIGFQIDLNRVRFDETAFNYAHKKYNSGYSLQFVHFSNQVLGNAFNAAYFMEPFLINRRAFSIRIRAAGGISYETNPYNAATIDSLNIVYSTHINGYLALGLSAYVKVHKNIKVFAAATYSHFSNGNTKNPNYGVNYPNVSVGLDYTFLTTEKPCGKMYFYSEHWRYDAIVFGSNKSTSIAKLERFWVYGAGVLASYRSGLLHAWTASAEILNDQSTRYNFDHSKTESLKNNSSILSGIMLGHEFLLNRCIFSQQLGYYIFKDNPELMRIYHRWGISYKLNKQIRIGLNLNASLQRAYVFDVRLSYSFYH